MFKYKISQIHSGGDGEGIRQDALALLADLTGAQVKGDNLIVRRPLQGLEFSFPEINCWLQLELVKI